MPSSKRTRKSIPAASKHPNKLELVAKIRELAEKYDFVHQLKMHNMKNVYLTFLREHFADSVFRFGKNRVMSKALDMDIKGDTWLLFTNRPLAELEAFFADWKRESYAKHGFEATLDVIIPSGPLVRIDGTSIPHSMETQVRDLGLPTKLEKGVVMVTKEAELCKKGDSLTKKNALLLKHLKIKMAISRVEILSK